MGIAILSAQLTEKHCYPVGACIVNNNKIIVGTGCNGLPKGCKNKKDRSLYGMTNIKKIIIHKYIINIIMLTDILLLQIIHMYVIIIF